MMGLSCGCAAVRDVSQMRDNLDAIGPPIQEFPAVRKSIDDMAVRAAAIQLTAEQMATTLDGVHAEMRELSGEVGQLSGVVRDLERLEQKLDLVNLELVHLSRLRDGIENVQRRLGTLNDLHAGITSINGQLVTLNAQLSEMHDSLAVVNGRLERLDSIDSQLRVVDDSIRKLHKLIPIVAFAIPLLALWMLGSLYGQWLARRRTKL